MMTLADSLQRHSTDLVPTRFLSEPACAALAKRAAGMAIGGGHTGMTIASSWTGNTRWARNRISTSGDVRNNFVYLSRDIRGASSTVDLNQIDEASLHAATRRAERLLLLKPEDHESALRREFTETYLHPTIWSDTTYHLAAGRRAEVMQTMVQSSVAAGMLSAGYLEVAAHGRAVMDDRGRSMYYPYTTAQCSVTVRDPKGTGSGWAGVDDYDWARIDTAQLSARALDKCLRSRNPVAVEPGHYTAILEPQAVCDLLNQLFWPRGALERTLCEGMGRGSPFGRGDGNSRIGERVWDERLTVSADPMDPDLGFPPFNAQGEVFHPVQWMVNGVLKELAYDHDYAVKLLGTNTPLPNSGAFRMSGGTSTIDDMVATTKRGFLVTRFSEIQLVDPASWLLRGYTRDGLWLVENGKISKPVKNFLFVESPMFVFNQVEAIGMPVRVFRPGSPAIVPSLKVRDFNFASLADAV